MAQHQDQANNYVAHTAKSVFNRVDLRATVASALTEDTPLADIDLCITAQPDTGNGLVHVYWPGILSALQSTALRRLDAVPAELATSLSELRVAVIGSAAFFEQISTVCPQAFAVDPKEPMAFIDGTVDVLIINMDAAATSQWHPFFAGARPDTPHPLAPVLDKCRVYGIQSIFLRDVDSVLNSSFYSVARKADHVCVVKLTGAVGLLQLHPIAIRTITPWLEALPLADAAAVMFRGAGIAVLPPELTGVPTAVEAEEEGQAVALSEAAGASAEDDGLDIDAVWNEQSEHLTVFFPAHEQNAVEAFIAQQGMPEHLLTLRPYAAVTADSEADAPLRAVVDALDDAHSGYVCVLESLGTVAPYYLRTLWLSADEGCVVRPAHKVASTTSLSVKHEASDAIDLRYGDVFSTSIAGRRGQDIIVISVPVLSNVK